MLSVFSSLCFIFSSWFPQPYSTYHTRYMALDCLDQHNTTFFETCCHPLLVRLLLSLLFRSTLLIFPDRQLRISTLLVLQSAFLAPLLRLLPPQQTPLPPRRPTTMTMRTAKMRMRSRPLLLHLQLQQPPTLLLILPPRRPQQQQSSTSAQNLL